MLVATVGVAKADGLQVDIAGSETGQWSSNPLLATGDVKALFGSTTSPEITLKNATPTSSLSLDTRVDHNQFNQSAFNSTDAHANADTSLQNQRWQIGSHLLADYDTTRTSEITDFGLHNVIARHTGLGVAPQVSYTPNALDTFSISGSAASSRYNNSFFTDYATYAVTPSYSRHVDPLNTGTFSVQAQRYQSTKGPSIRIDSLGPMLGWQTALSPRFSFHASAGAQTARQYNGGVAAGSWTWQPVFAAGLSFKGKEDSIDLDGTRSQFPYGNGTEALQTKYEVEARHALNSAFTLTFGGSYVTASYQVFTPDTVDNLATGHVGIDYHMTEHIDLDAHYQYRIEQLTGSGATPKDHAVMLSLAYHPTGA